MQLFVDHFLRTQLHLHQQQQYTAISHLSVLIHKALLQGKYQNHYIADIESFRNSNQTRQIPHMFTGLFSVLQL